MSFNDQLNEYDMEWRAPDNRINTLKKRTEDLIHEKNVMKNDIITIGALINSTTNSIDAIKSSHATHIDNMATFQNEVMLLVDMGKLEHTGIITKDEYKTMLKLFESVDDENRVVLRELVTEKLKLI